MTADFLIRNHGSQKEVAHTFKVLKYQSRILYPMKIHFNNEKKIKTYQIKRN